jgi:hypothetical protein
MHVFFANPEPLFLISDRLMTRRTDLSITPIVSASLKAAFSSPVSHVPART